MEETEATGSFEAARDRRPRSPSRAAAPKRPRSRKNTVEVVDEGWGEHSVGASETPWNSDDDERQQEFADDARSVAAGSSAVAARDARSSSRASSRSRAPSSMPSATTATSPSRSRRSPARCSPRSSADAAEVERVLRRRAGARSARRRRALRGRVHRAAAAAAGSGTRRASTPRIEIARHHLELVAERELSLLRRELRATEEEIALRAGAGALPAIRARAPRSAPAPAEYVVPDVFVRRTDHGWAVEINCRHAAARAPQPGLREPASAAMPATPPCARSCRRRAGC